MINLNLLLGKLEKMSYQGSPFSAVYGPDDFDLDDDNEEYMDDDRDVDDPDESDEG